MGEKREWILLTDFLAPGEEITNLISIGEEKMKNLLKAVFLLLWVFALNTIVMVVLFLAGVNGSHKGWLAVQGYVSVGCLLLAGGLALFLLPWLWREEVKQSTLKRWLRRVISPSRWIN